MKRLQSLHLILFHLVVTEADTDTSRKGNVWYHESSDPVSLNRASEQISRAYPEANYNAKSLFIATWEQVGYYDAAVTKVNWVTIQKSCIIYLLCMGI